jgi:hypothetical protein
LDFFVVALRGGFNRPPPFYMHIYLKHPVHGAKVATLEAEAEQDEKNGWTRYNLDTPLSIEEAAPVNCLEVKRQRSQTPKKVFDQGA